MRDCPDTAGLLETARDLLREELLPSLDDSLRYKGLMVCNALAIAARQFRSARFPVAEELREVCRLVSGDGAAWSAPGSADDDAALIAANRLLCQQIRAGRFDPGRPGRAELNAYLMATTRAKVAESNPKALGNSP